MVQIVTGRPIANDASKYINGLGIAPGATTTTLALSSGAARDSTNVADIGLSADVTINAANVGANGIDTGALAASTFYYVFVIGSSLSASPEIDIDIQVSPLAAGTIILDGKVLSEGQVTQPTYTVTNNMQPAGLISLSATAPTLPVGYDMFRRVGAVLTSGGSVFLPFFQDDSNNGQNRKMWYDTPISVLAASAAAAMTAQSLAVAVPVIALAGKASEVTLQADLLPNAAANFVQLRSTGSAAAAGNVKMSGSVAGVHKFDQLDVAAAVSAGAASIDWMTDAASTVQLSVSAYVDKL
jgi:hypothetical protein